MDAATIAAPVTPLTVSVAEACVMTRLGLTKMYELIGSGKVESTTVGRRRLIKVDSLKRLLGEVA